jgi:predicted Zn-dependent protease
MTRFPKAERAARAAALLEYENALALEADWPSGQVNLGNLRLRQGRGDEAIAAFEACHRARQALTGAYVNLADACASSGANRKRKRCCAGAWRHCRVMPTCTIPSGCC